jgi:preprotein translocase subunit SecE
MSVSKTADGSSNLSTRAILQLRIETMNRLVTYLKESYNELMHKVTWPTWSELQSSAWIVMIAALIIAVVIYGMDAGSGSIMKLFYNI